MSRAVVAAALLLAAGCLRRAPTPSPEEGAWPKVRDQNTRGVKLYDGLATSAFASATWEAPAVRAARIERTATWKAMTAEERASLQATEDAAAAQFEEFTVTLFTPERDDNDLDAPRPSWRIALVPEGGPETLPAEVHALRPDTLLRNLYPQVGDFDIVYRIRFRKAAGAELGERPFLLRLAGARGKLEFPFGSAAH